MKKLALLLLAIPSMLYSQEVFNFESKYEKPKQVDTVYVHTDFTSKHPELNLTPGFYAYKLVNGYGQLTSDYGKSWDLSPYKITHWRKVFKSRYEYESMYQFDRQGAILTMGITYNIVTKQKIRINGGTKCEMRFVTYDSPEYSKQVTGLIGIISKDTIVELNCDKTFSNYNRLIKTVADHKDYTLVDRLIDHKSDDKDYHQYDDVPYGIRIDDIITFYQNRATATSNQAAFERGMQKVMSASANFISQQEANPKIGSEYKDIIGGYIVTGEENINGLKIVYCYRLKPYGRNYYRLTFDKSNKLTGFKLLYKESFVD